MPTIPYPDVPYGVQGVPQVPIAPAGTPQPVSPVNTSTLAVPNTTPLKITSPYSDNWQIVDSNGQKVLAPDSVVSFEYRNDRNIPTYPVEQGGFASYNKIALPYHIRMIVTCGGSRGVGFQTRQNFLRALSIMLNTTDLFQIVTPDVVYGNANLVHVDYGRTARSGATLIKAELFFEEVITSAVSEIVPREPSGKTSVKNGQVSPVPPTASQTASIFNTPIQ